MTEQNMVKRLRRMPGNTCNQASLMYRRAVLKRIQKREFRRLKAILPSVSDKKKVSKVAIVQEAIRYIDELHEAINKQVEKLKSQGIYPVGRCKYVMMDELHQRALHNINLQLQNTQPGSVCQKDRRRPSYIAKITSRRS